MITVNNTRYQALPLYPDINEAFDIKYGEGYRTPLVYPSGEWPGFQIISRSGVSSAALVNIDTGTETAVSYSTTTADLNGDEDDETIDTAAGSTGAPDGRYRAKVVYAGIIHYSDVIEIGCNVSARLVWSHECNKPYAYYGGSWENILYFHDFTYNRLEPETERVEDANGEIIATRTKTYYSFTRLVPDYLIGAFKALEEPDALISLEDAGINTGIYLKDVRVSVSTPVTDNHHVVTVQYRLRDYDPGLIPSGIYHYEEIDGIKVCDTIPYIDEDLTGPGSGSGSCPGFGITISESGGNLTYAIASEPIDGNLLVQWFFNGVPVSTGSSIALGSYGTYKVVATKDGCTVSDTYAFLSPCALMTLSVAVNLGVISANVTNAPGAVTYEVFDEDSLIVATSLPYTALADGTYTVVATSDDCEIQEQVTVNLSSGCSHTSIITKNGSTLNASSDDPGATFEWFLDEGTGLVSISTASQISISKNGLYVLIASVGGCPVETQLVVTDQELNVNVNLPNIVITVHGNDGHVYPVTWIANDCIVKRNGTTIQPVAGAPGPGEYKLNAASFEVASYLPLALGEIITIESQ